MRCLCVVSAFTIFAYMVERNKTKRYIAEKIALLVILVISLLAARLVVGLRAVIRLTVPIELSRSGLSISMPQGNGWRCNGKWVYDDDSYTLNSVFAVRAGSVRSYARCRYLLARQTAGGQARQTTDGQASQEHTPQQRFDEEAAAVGGEVVETGRMNAGEAGAEESKLVVDWARISGDDGLEIILGVCGLAGGRQLEIEVFQARGEQGLAQNIFERIVKGVQFNNNGLLQAAARVVSELRDTGLSDIPDDNQPNFFILSDANGRAIGFTMDVMEVLADEEPALRAASYFYGRGLAANEEAGFFHGDITFSRFDWRVIENSPRTGRKVIEMSADSGVLTVRKSGPGGKEKEYALGKAAVPDIVLEPVLQELLGNGPREIVIDVIRPEGNIVPVYIEKINQADSNSIKLEVLDGHGYRQQIYYDDAKQPTKIVLEQDGTYTLNRATAEQIAKTFPERADLVLKQDLSREGF